MNKILVANGLLLISLMGFQQWYGAHAHLACFSPWEGLGLIFALISLIIPFSAFLLGKIEKRSTKREVLALIAFNPIFFSILAFSYQQLTYEWSLSKIAGPQVICKADRSEGCGFYGGFFPILLVPAAINEVWTKATSGSENRS